MRHLKAGRKLGRNATHRRALMRNLARALFNHERIITTEAKAKALRPFAEKLITLAKKGTLHARRLCLSRLDDREMVAKLFDEIGPRFADRPGGYTRIIKRHERRLGDAGYTAFIELLKPGEVKAKKTAPEAPAPRVTEEPPAPQETPASQETPPAESPETSGPEASESATPESSAEGTQASSEATSPEGENKPEAPSS